MRCLVSINYVDYKQINKRHNQRTAIEVLLKNAPKNTELATVNFCDDKIIVPPSFHILPMLQKDAREKLGHDRRMPYVKEIMDVCANMPFDVIGYMNSDILVKKDFFDVFKKDINAYVFYKRDIEHLSSQDFLCDKIKVVEECPAGMDGVFFNRKWWLANRHHFPDDLVLGETEWDSCYASIVQSIGKNYVLSRSLYHIVHNRIWKLHTKAAVNNIAIWNQVRDKYGFPHLVPETRET